MLINPSSYHDKTRPFAFFVLRLACFEPHTRLGSQHKGHPGNSLKVLPAYD